MTLVFLLCTLALAQETAERWDGRFAISGFSFNGAIPGELIIGPEQTMHLSLFRPSGLPIMSVTVLQQEICFDFEMDGVQYRGSHNEFSQLSEGGLPAERLYLLFQPDSSISPDGWSWLSTPKHPVRKLEVTVKERTLLRAGYKKWDVDNPHRIYIYLEPNAWKMRANIQLKDTVPWTYNCQVSTDLTVRPLAEMRRSLPPNR